MIFFKSTLLKYLPYLVAAILAFAVLWKINSTFNENAKLHKQLAETNIVLSQYKESDAKNKEIILAMQNRIAKLNQIEQERNRKVQVKTESAKKYIQETKDGVDTAENIDKFLMDRYNGILECIERVTKDEDDNC